MLRISILTQLVLATLFLLQSVPLNANAPDYQYSAERLYLSNQQLREQQQQVPLKQALLPHQQYHQHNSPQEEAYMLKELEQQHQQLQQQHQQQPHIQASYYIQQNIQSYHPQHSQSQQNVEHFPSKHNEHHQQHKPLPTSQNHDQLHQHHRQPPNPPEESYQYQETYEYHHQGVKQYEQDNGQAGPHLSQKGQNANDQYRSVAQNMQQVFFRIQDETTDFEMSLSGIELSGSSPDGPIQVSDYYVKSYESSLSVDDQNRRIVYEHEHRQHIERHHHGQDYMMDHRPMIVPQLHPMGSCLPIMPSTLMQTEHKAPTCASADPSASSSGVTKQVPNLSQQISSKQSHNSNIDSYPLAQPQYQYENSLMGAIQHYWREVLALCLISAVLLNWLFLVIKRRLAMVCNHVVEEIVSQPLNSTSKTTSTSKDITNSQAHDSAFDEIASANSLYYETEISSISSSDASEGLRRRKFPKERKTASNLSLPITPQSNSYTSGTLRQRSSTLKASDPIAIPAKSNAAKSKANQQQQQPLTTSSLTNSSFYTNSPEFNSRYSQDFDSIRRLGRGGFGVVFEAKNKIDDCCYAVKRICLPLEKEARDRVMREVRALAKLDHAGIVRYYNAWVETPPEEWVKKHDADLGLNNHSKDGLSFASDGLSESCDTRGIGGDSSIKLIDNSTGFFGRKKFKHNNLNARLYKQFLKRNNSSSPSLDIVFEGSGSIKLESENSCENSEIHNSNNKKSSSRCNGVKSKFLKHNIDGDGKCNNNGDNNLESDGEDSDFIQFKSSKIEEKARCQWSKSNGKLRNDDIVSNEEDDEQSLDESDDDDNIDDLDISNISHLTEPFSSSSSSGNEYGLKTGQNENKRLNNNCNGITKDQEEDDMHIDDDVFGVKTRNNGIAGTSPRKDSLNLKKRALAYQKELKLLNNTSIVDNIHKERVYLYIQMQLCHKETLRDWLKTNCENRDKTEIFDLFYQIVDAVEYVHAQDLIHRDLKPSNIFFSLDRTTVKIGDFGLCRAKTSTNAIGSSLDLQEYVAESDVERGFEAVHTEQVGTQLYMSPEQLNGLSYNQKVDIFAMGLILLELMIPFKTQMHRVNVLFKARNNLYSEEFSCNHPREQELVKSLLSRSPTKRPTATEIKQHELLASAQLSPPVVERINQRRRTISSNSSND